MTSLLIAVLGFFGVAHVVVEVGEPGEGIYGGAVQGLPDGRRWLGLTATP